MNREIFPYPLYPLQGDVTSNAGDPNVKVTGLQGVPLTAGASDKQSLVFSLTNNDWAANDVPFNQSIKVNGQQVSDDYLVVVNVPKGILVNGV